MKRLCHRRIALLVPVVLWSLLGGSPSLATPIESKARATPPSGWDIKEVKRGAETVQAIITRRYQHATTYRLALGQLEKNTHQHADSAGFSTGAQLALAHWVARLPEDTPWKAKALARHRDVSHWLARESPIRLKDIAHTVAEVREGSPADESWLIDAMKGEPARPLPTRVPPARSDQ